MALPPVPPTATTELTRTVLAPNPGPMTLEGTNSYVIGRRGAGAVIVDPGPADERHLSALGAARDVQLILITHRHPDHTEGAARLHELTGAPVRAADPVHCHGGGTPLAGPERIESAGVVIEAVPTPGHTDDSVSFLLPDDGPGGSMLTGDTILGRGTTVIAHPDGSVADYLRSLDRLQGYGAARVLPAHGPQLASLEQTCREYRDHRLLRLEQIREVLRRLGADATIDQVVDAVYTDTPAQVRFAAMKSVAAQLEYLRNQQ
ncbi:MBL fold metallo-hydrolase [Nakamurella lactea]|uniref:MBL fold metallo-hydrolase n=1 Tax=Nakamurella lactea TaxID=459515 RepID=UPI0004127B43|nr:MBL fold metallo-hydrolase [Nakamurella lactea]